jgi:putative ABC transport system ATP-binding protein
MNFLRLENLSKAYIEGGNRRIVLQDATISMDQGEFTAILGKSGSGKTTLLNLVSGIDLADQGRIYIGDIDLTGLNDLQRTLYRRQNIGFIFQFFNLIPTLTVWENVILPLELNGLANEQGQERACTLLSDVGTPRPAAYFPRSVIRR